MSLKPAWDFDTVPVKIHYINERNIHRDTLDKSDISFHLPLLKFLAHQCEYIVEFGVREANSSIALLSGHPKQLLSVDINPTPMYDMLSQYPNWKFIQKSSTDPSLYISYPDMLFIDSLHTYEHCSEELRMHAHNVQKWIVFHDTQSCPEVNLAVQEFLDKNPEWKEVYFTPTNHGLTIIQRYE